MLAAAHALHHVAVAVHGLRDKHAVGRVAVVGAVHEEAGQEELHGVCAAGDALDRVLDGARAHVARGGGRECVVIVQ